MTIFLIYHQKFLDNKLIFFQRNDSEENNIIVDKQLKRANTSLINLRKLDDDFMLPENGKW